MGIPAIKEKDMDKFFEKYEKIHNKLKDKFKDITPEDMDTNIGFYLSRYALPINKVKDYFKDKKLYDYNSLNVMISEDNGKKYAIIQHSQRFPYWSELQYIRKQLLPTEKTFSLLLPEVGNHVKGANDFSAVLWEIDLTDKEREAFFRKVVTQGGLKNANKKS